MNIKLDQQGLHKVLKTMINFIDNNLDSTTSVINNKKGTQYLFTLNKEGDNEEVVLEFVSVDKLEEDWDKEIDEIKEPKQYEE